MKNGKKHDGELSKLEQFQQGTQQDGQQAGHDQPKHIEQQAGQHEPKHIEQQTGQHQPEQFDIQQHEPELP